MSAQCVANRRAAPGPLHLPCRKDGRWVLFNDEKVAASQEPPLDRGYLYLYRREDHHPEGTAS